MSNLLICLGLDGQRILRSYLRWSRLGTAGVADSFGALAIASEPFDSRLGFARTLLKTISRSGGTSGKNRSAWIRECVFGLSKENVRVDSLLAGGRAESLHPVRAFLDEASLAASVSTGCRTRPCMVPTLWSDYGLHLDDAIDESLSALDGASVNVVVTGSLSDGLAAGLLVPVLDRLLEHELQPVVSAVLFRAGSWSESSAEDDLRFDASNVAGVLSTLLDRYQGARQFGLYRVVLLDGEPPLVGTDPIAEACWAFDRLFGELAPTHPTEATELLVDIAEVRRASRQIEAPLAHAFAALEFLAARGRVENMAIDPAARRIWGSALPDYIEAHWARPVADSTSFDRKKYLRRLEDSLASVLEGARALLVPRRSPPDLRALIDLTRNLPAAKTLPVIREDPASAAAAGLLIHVLGSASQ